jgi:hypothetical protein
MLPFIPDTLAEVAALTSLLYPLISRIIKIVTANGLPMAEGKSEVYIHPLITWD